ncbi:SDR family NAD(P)-dependent oxidoreductase [Nocardia anaemiae]|uniref:SDR family NAD(P)-dependent oxidoreductase n=1 Tax=Nocardia anaemiae TaxID=263910 RepID=UPI000A022B14|nr:SDR family NAD(P)-dependent oxidoreductase [Nocardia anaemiae]
MVSIANKAVLVTGSNRGIGQALVEEALNRGAKRVYAAARVPLAHPDTRVTPLTLDVTDRQQIQNAVADIEALDILINNAGVAIYDELSDRSILEQHLAVNVFGTFDVTNAFLPLLASSKGAVVNNLSMNALVPMQIIPSYSVSKAAGFSMTQSLRALVARQGVAVHAVLTGIVDTDMSRDLDIPKASPESVARAVFDGLEKDEEEIFPDVVSETLAEGWRNGALKSLERQNATMTDQFRAQQSA